MEDIGYILSETPFLFLILWFAVQFVRWRRARDKRPAFSASDERILFHAARYGPDHWQFYPRLILASLVVAALASAQLIVLAPLGAAILSVTILLTSATVVHEIMLREE